MVTSIASRLPPIPRDAETPKVPVAGSTPELIPFSGAGASANVTPGA
jgi:hypothetical protein